MITGATAGFGKATAELFAQEGWNLILTGRRADRLSELKSALESHFDIQVLTLAFDVRQNEEVVAAINSIPKEWQAIDVLLNNAGLAVGKDPIQDGELDDWERMIDTNVKGLLYVSKAISPWMTQREKGHIINIGSIAGKEVYPNGNVYCATKHAVDALSKGMRLDLMPHGIKVTQICPGAAETEFSLVRYKGDQAKADATYQGFTPLYAEDIAQTVLFCATRPAHVNINDMIVMPAAQASSTKFKKS